jgi:hypothetical protein
MISSSSETGRGGITAGRVVLVVESSRCCGDITLNVNDLIKIEEAEYTSHICL